MAFHLYWGDFHCHTGLSYGAGASEAALINGRDRPAQQGLAECAGDPLTAGTKSVGHDPDPHGSDARRCRCEGGRQVNWQVGGV
jgi:hypothetical protein